MHPSARQTSLLSFFGSPPATSTSPSGPSDSKKNVLDLPRRNCSSTPRSKDARNAEMFERSFMSPSHGECLSPVTKENGNATSKRRSKRVLIVESDSDLDEEECKLSRVEQDTNFEVSDLFDERENEGADVAGLENQHDGMHNTSEKDATEKIASFSFQSIANSSANDILNSSVTSEYSMSVKSFSTAENQMNKYGDNSDSPAAFRHLEFEFLKPNKIMDIEKRRPNNPDYDEHTLYVPPSFLKSQTPGHRQWWQMKATNFDTVLFFKVGKFYELYHMDAVIGAKCLNLTYMKGDYAHCGFPESSLNRFVDRLIEKGYKVARVEQTETPEAMEKRAEKECLAGKDRVVRREICRIVTRATKMYSYLEAEDEAADAFYLTAICEQIRESSQSRRIGTCFVNASVGQIYLSEFDDDASFSRLRTIFATFPPAQVLFPRGKLSPEVMTLFKQSLLSIPREGLLPKAQFWSSSDTLRNLAKSGYFGSNDDGSVNWPPTLQGMLDSSDLVGMTVSSDHTLCLSSFGAIVWYLKECKIDDDVLQLRRINIYRPPDITKAEEYDTIPLQRKYMIMDEITLKNLDVVRLSCTDPMYTTLFDELNLCLTAAGKRLLRFWLCNPLYDIRAIEDRQKAIDELMNMHEFLDSTCSSLQGIPDLERLLQKMHSLAIKAPGVDHPECRAVFFEVDKYNKRKLSDFIALINGFGTAKQIYDSFQKIYPKLHFRSTLLLDLLGRGSFPDVEADLRFFQTCFDHEKAAKEGVVIPSRGVDHELDSVDDDIQRLKAALDDYLVYTRKVLRCSNVKYIGSGRNRFLLEVPEDGCEKVKSEFELRSRRKGFVRFSTPKLDQLIERLTQSETKRESVLKDIMRRLFADFCSRGEKWYKIVESLAVLDVLQSFAQYARNCPHTICKPVFVSNETPFLRLKNSVHPCCSKMRTNSDFIPNDVQLGSDAESGSGPVLLLTGANMGGKSTLMRQVGTLIIMAQLGAPVPAESFILTPVDRMFTRIGARDSLLTGQSTLFVELSETTTILRHASANSFAIVDELGRGTSTHDGTAIASATLKHLAERICCRAIFSTHYHSLVQKFSDHPLVQLGHMACAVENEGLDDPVEESVTFLYKLTAGPCPKSYGFNAAKLAGLKTRVIRNAYAASVRFSRMDTLYNAVTKMVKENSEASDHELVQALSLKLSVL
uniref:DNA mismatch repair protein n=1 Tax=Trichuris muris TaxID=70415 RepID=A0A5S6QUH0_TRIMR